MTPLGEEELKKGCGTVFFGVLILLVLGAIGSAFGLGEETDAAPSPTSPHDIGTTEADSANVTFISAIDGDTIKTSAGTVRLIGIDTPERGECGYDEARTLIDDYIWDGDEISLVLPPGQNDTDVYDRLLRYVYTAEGDDIGLVQIQEGNAVARYDSYDGYPSHPHEDAYHDAQLAEFVDGWVITAECADADSDAPLESVEVEPEPAAGNAFTPETEVDAWWMQYPSCSSLKKNTVGDPKGPFNVNDPAEVDIYNWFQYGTGYRGDGDGDGLACE